MSQKIVQIEEQKQEQQLQLHVNLQQRLTLHLLKMPLAELEEKVDSLIDDNPALEKDFDAEEENSFEQETANNGQEESYDEENANDDYEAAADENVEDYNEELSRTFDEMSRTDEYDDFDIDNTYYDKDKEKDDFVAGEISSFYDKLIEQMGETQLTDEERTIMEYLIGTLDTDGLLRKDLTVIGDELAVYLYIDADEDKILSVLHKLQQFEPAGIGARSLQECLLLQIERMPASYNRQVMLETVRDYYDSFIKKHWHVIQENLGLSDESVQDLILSLRKLNPKPGNALGEAVGRSINQITPDIIIEKDEEGKVSFTLSHGRLPHLKVSEDYLNEMKNLENTPDAKLSRSQIEAREYYKEKVESAQLYIEAIRHRYKTMALLTKAIIRWQQRYFVDGDESELRKMVLQDIASETGVDISTVSRFNNEKYVDTPWGIKPMRFFFSEGIKTDGENLSIRRIKLKLKEMIDNEDKRKPLSDLQIAERMEEQGFSIARRTVSKYREEMNIPIKRMRREGVEKQKMHKRKKEE